MIAFLIAAGMIPELLLQGSTRDDVWVEIIKLVGIIISACASSFALWIANRNRKTTKRVERKVDTKRAAVRRTETRGQDPTVTIVEDRREPRDGDR